MAKVITANSLTTGHVVFLTDSGAWTETIDQAHMFDDDAAAGSGLEQAAADAQKAIVVEPFIADVVAEQGGRWKMTLRDTIRAYGPTISYHRGAAVPAKGV